MTLLKRKRVCAAKIETTVGTAISLSASDAAMNVYDMMIQANIPMEEREGQSGFGYLPSVPGGYGGTATFKTDIGWDGTGLPAWATTFLPACGFVASAQVYYPKTAVPGADVKTLTIGGYIGDGTTSRYNQLHGAVGTFKIVCPTGKMAYFDWTFTGIWTTPTDISIIDPTYPVADIPLRAAGGATTYNSVSLCASNCTIDMANEVMLRECSTSVTGYHAAIITNRNPKITIDPEAKLVATRPSFTNWLARTEASFSMILASATGNGTFTITAPKAQLINVQEGDRNRLVTDDLEFQCNRNANTEDQEISLTFADDA